MALHTDGDPHQGSYLDVSTHKDMLRDVVRTSAYHDAIRQLVRPGDRVIDFGSGTGVLAIFAARAGAQVEAIERTAMVVHAREIARRSGCPSIRFHHADHHSFEGAARADLIVSEWMGHAVFYESMLEPLIALRDRWLRPGGKMLPARVSIGCALVTDEALYDDFGFLEHSPYGIDFGPIAGLPLRQSHLVALDESQVAAATELGRLDMLSITRSPELLSARLDVTSAAETYGLALWFEAELAPGVTLGTGPCDPPTHWRQVFLPFPQPFAVTPGRPLRIEVRPPRDVEHDVQGEAAAWAWRVSDGERVLAVDERESWPSLVARNDAEARPPTPHE
jgi:SAM-dependent methyltransferase